MSEPPVLEYSPPTTTVTPDDRYYVRVLAYVHLILGPLAVASGVMLYFAIATHNARVGAISMIAGGAWLAAAGVTLLVRCWRWFGISAGLLILFGFPVGTIIGIATIAVLCRRGVRELYRQRATSQ